MEKIIIDEDLRNKIERCHYEYTALVNVEKTYLDSHMLDDDTTALDGVVFKAYHEKLVQALKDYEEAKSEMTEKHGIGNASWSLDFKTCEVEIV